MTDDHTGKPRLPAAKAPGRAPLRTALAFILALVFAAHPSFAEEIIRDQPYAGWDRTAAEAAEVLERSLPNLTVLERLRAELADQRDTAFDIAETGSVQARALQAQIDALGPPPPEGETEPTELAARRAQLTSALSAANAPVIDAREALRRAEVLIRELDAKIRAASTQRLITRLPTPLLPGAWAALRDDFGRTVARIRNDQATTDPVSGTMLPLAAISGLAALLLIFLIEPVVTARLLRLRRQTFDRHRGRAIGVLAFLLRLSIPLAGLGVFFLATGFFTAGLPNMAGLRPTLAGLPLILLSAHVLGHLLFAPKHPDQRVFRIDDRLARRGYGLSLLLGIYLALNALWTTVQSDFVLDAGTQSVLAFFVVLTGLYPIWRLARFILGTTEQRDDLEQIARETRRLFARFLQLAAILAGIAALLGYVNLAHKALEPSVLTVALVAVGIYLHNLIVGVIEDTLGTRTADEEEGAFLLSFFVTLTIAFAAVPALALIWGARSSDIADIWRLLTTGVEIGDSRISLTNAFTLIAVFLLGLVATRWLQRMLRNTFLPRTRLDRGAQTSIATGVGYVGVTIAALIAISSAGINLSSLAVVFGALSVGIGFGLQNIVSNFVSGIILLVERPVKEGDWIEVSGHSGIVRKIAVRSTRIETFDRFDVIVPNADLISGTVKNMTLANQDGRLLIPVGVAYGSDLETVKQILLGVVEGRTDILADPPPAVIFTGLGDSALDFELRCYIPDVAKTVTTKSDLLFDIYTRLTAAGIEIPFPQRDISLKGIDRLADAIRSLGNSAPT